MKFLRNVAGYILKDLIRGMMTRNKLNILHLNNRIQKNGLNWIHHVERVAHERIPKQLTIHLEEPDPLDAGGYAGMMNPSCRGTERIERSRP
jgi:hypothetical protein